MKEAYIIGFLSIFFAEGIFSQPLILRFLWSLIWPIRLIIVLFLLRGYKHEREANRNR